MVEAKHLFDGYDEEGFHNHRCHMHEIVSLLGDPPSKFLQRSPHTWRLFDENGEPSSGPYYLHQSIPTDMKPRKMESSAVDRCYVLGDQDETIQGKKSRRIFGFHELHASLASRRAVDCPKTSPAPLAPRNRLTSMTNAFNEQDRVSGACWQAGSNCTGIPLIAPAVSHHR